VSAGIRNYSIYRYQQFLFSYFELPEDVTLDNVDRVLTQSDACLRWEKLMQTLQEPLSESGAADW
jgi:L-rhamnose mutarotase